MPYIDIVGRWKARHEDAGAVANRLAHLFAGLASIDALFNGWERGGMRHRSTVPRFVTLPPKTAELRDWIAENPRFVSNHGHKQLIGYSANATTPENEQIRASLWLSADLRAAPGRADNRLWITLFSNGDGLIHDGLPRLLAIVRYALVTLATVWDCEWVGVLPGLYGNTRLQPGQLPPRYQRGWMVYLEPSLAARMRRLKDVVVEQLPGGAILATTVPTAVFDRGNEIHRAAARRLQDALAPLNRAAERKHEDG